MDVLDAFQSELAASTDRLVATVARLSDADLTAPSRLPGWTRGHLITHIARNADSLVNLTEWARTGVERPQYPSVESRDADIAAGAVRPAKEQLADLEESAARLATAFRDLPPRAWSAMVGGMRPPPHPAWYLLVRRLRETEFHHVDLDAGYDCSAWSDAFVRRELHDVMVCWPREPSPISEIVVEEVKDDHKHRQVWRGLGSGPVVQGDARTLLAWLTGRSAGAGLRVMREGATGNEPAAGPLPAPPPWLIMTAAPGLPATPPEEYP
ncbi:maleylpyruvate isomerase family mycothiol-dependent enzyme [Planobispora longispora]|uniref:Maleylpyruvate isomerase n=1 Tax=Planobispora longispora TaxID=28887 RepID=A0A8J3RIP0_9ACTN|nr:maleylpyruvate isomerase family mycothiol-dependent enzyme [Planobispora longispora]GIH77141.1 maleylpyruvate isomerase [Planobispora longispora]